MISQRVAEIRRHIEKVCVSLNRDPREIAVIAVTKYTDVEHVMDLFSTGLLEIAESRVQDAEKKIDILERKGFVFKRHMIGHLQTNKVRAAVRLFDMIQSVDSVKTARAIDTQSAACGKIMEVLVQINASDEPQKSGVRPNEALDLLQEISGLQHLRVMGLMTIGLLSGDPVEIGSCFQRTREVFERARIVFDGHPRVQMSYLSMGMSGDYEIALQHGANMLRIGSAIFS